MYIICIRGIMDKPGRQLKRQKMENWKEKCSSKSVVFIKSKDLTVEEATILRRAAKKHNVNVSIIKNTLLRLALKEQNMDSESIFRKAKGSTVMALSGDDVLKSINCMYADKKSVFLKKIELMAILDESGAVTEEKTLNELKKFKSREIFAVSIISSLLTPIRQLGRLLSIRSESEK